MADANASSSAATILARPFLKGTTEEQVRELFGGYGSVMRVRLRYQQSNMQQKDSVYVEFATTASADAAVADPPSQLNGIGNKLQCIHKRVYEQQQQNLPQASSLATSAGKRKPASSDSIGAATEDEKIKRRKKQILAQQQTIEELQNKLQQEQEQTSQLRAALQQAQQKAADAAAKEKTAQALLVSKGVELASLSGQLNAADRKVKAGMDKVHAQYRPKIQNFEAQMQQLQEALESEISRNRKRTQPKFEL